MLVGCILPISELRTFKCVAEASNSCRILKFPERSEEGVGHDFGISLLKCKGVSESVSQGMMGYARRDRPLPPAAEVRSIRDRSPAALSHLGRERHRHRSGFIEMFFDSYGDMQRRWTKRGYSLAALEPLVENPFPRWLW